MNSEESSSASVQNQEANNKSAEENTDHDRGGEHTAVEPIGNDDEDDISDISDIEDYDESDTDVDGHASFEDSDGNTNSERDAATNRDSKGVKSTPGVSTGSSSECCSAAKRPPANLTRNLGQCLVCKKYWCLANPEHCNMSFSDYKQFVPHHYTHGLEIMSYKEFCSQCGTRKDRSPEFNSVCVDPCSRVFCTFEDCPYEAPAGVPIYDHRIQHRNFSRQIACRACHTPKPTNERLNYARCKGPGCSLLWCLIGNCGRHFRNFSKLDNHRYIFHREEAVGSCHTNSKACSKCNTSKEGSVGDWRQCPSCSSYWWCLINDCPSEFSRIENLERHRQYIHELRNFTLT